MRIDRFWRDAKYFCDIGDFKAVPPKTSGDLAFCGREPTIKGGQEIVDVELDLGIGIDGHFRNLLQRNSIRGLLLKEVERLAPGEQAEPGGPGGARGIILAQEAVIVANQADIDALSNIEHGFGISGAAATFQSVVRRAVDHWRTLSHECFPRLGIARQTLLPKLDDDVGIFAQVSLAVVDNLLLLQSNNA
jgi:hypothetical protein